MIAQVIKIRVSKFDFFFTGRRLMFSFSIFVAFREAVFFPIIINTRKRYCGFFFTSLKRNYLRSEILCNSTQMVQLSQRLKFDPNGLINAAARSKGAIKKFRYGFLFHCWGSCGMSLKKPLCRRQYR